MVTGENTSRVAEREDLKSIFIFQIYTKVAACVYVMHANARLNPAAQYIRKVHYRLFRFLDDTSPVFSPPPNVESGFFSECKRQKWIAIDASHELENVEEFVSSLQIRTKVEPPGVNVIGSFS